MNISQHHHRPRPLGHHQDTTPVDLIDSDPDPNGSPRTGATPDPKRQRAGALHNVSRPPALLAFTLVEIMVVVVILGILAATIIPLFRGTTHDAKVGAAKANIAELESALERFSVHMDRYPSTEEGLRVLVDPPSDAENKWRGPYIKILRLDPWKAPYQYRMPGLRHTTSFDLWSRGADKSDGGEGEGADIGNWEP